MSFAALLNPILSSAIAVKGLSKLSPQMKNFFGYGAAAGFGTDQMMDFLRSKAESEGYADFKEKISSGTPRPDELASQERVKRSERPLDIAQGALSTAAGLGGALLGAGGRLGGGSARRGMAGEGEGDPMQMGFTQPLQLQDQRFAGQSPEEGEIIETGFSPGTKEKNQFSLNPRMQPNSRAEALTQYNEMNKRKKLIDQLNDDYEQHQAQGQSAAEMERERKMIEQAIAAFEQKFGGAQQGALPRPQMSAPDWKQIMGGGAKNPPKSPNNIQRLMGILEQMQRGQ